MSEARIVVRWEGWVKAFGYGPKPESGEREVSLRLSRDDFRTALKALDHEHDGLSSGDPRYQTACRSGRLEWYDEGGACVEIVREGSFADRQAEVARQARADASASLDAQFPKPPREESTSKGRIVVPPGLEDAEVGSIGYAGNMEASAAGVYREDPSHTTRKAETVQALADAVNASGVAKATANPPDFVTITSERPASGIVAAVKSVLPKGKKK